MNSRNIFLNPAAKVIFAVMLMATMFSGISAQAQQGNQLLGNIPVTGTTADGLFEGRLTVSSLSRNDAGQLVAAGVLRGEVNGQNVRQTFQDVVVNLTEDGQQMGVQQHECDILFLDVGPIFLDVLGLQVDLSQIVLDITAVRGPGNLLGNLLCAVAGLLDGFDLSGALGQVLDNILDAINRLL